MFIASVAFIVGLYIKVILLILPKLTVVDFSKFSIAAVLHLVAFARLFSEDVALTSSLLFSSLFFIGITSFFFMDKILPKITEGTILLYTLITLWICLETSFWSTQFGLLITILIAGCALFLLVLCTTKIRINASVQVVLVLLFLLLNISMAILFINIGNSLEYFKIGYEFNYNTILNVIVLGFLSFQVASNIFHILGIIPIPGKNQTLRHRIQQVREHAQKLRETYIDTDLSIMRTGIICLLFILLCLNTFLSFGFDSFMLLLFVLFVGTWVADDNSHKKSEAHKTENIHDVSLSKIKILLIIVLLGLIILPFVTYRLTRNIDLTVLDRPLFDNSVTTSSPGISSGVQLSDADVLVEKGLDAYNKRDYVNAEKYFLDALQLDPENKYAYNNLGLVYIFQERYLEVESNFLKAIALDSNYVNTYNNLGRFYYAIGEYKKSITYLSRSIELNPHAQTYISLGDVYAVTENDTEALKNYKKSKQLDPSHANIDEMIRMTEYRLRNK